MSDTLQLSGTPSSKGTKGEVVRGATVTKALLTLTHRCSPLFHRLAEAHSRAEAERRRLGSQLARLEAEAAEHAIEAASGMGSLARHISGLRGTLDGWGASFDAANSIDYGVGGAHSLDEKGPELGAARV